MEKGGDRALQGGFCFTRDGKSLEKTACSAGGPALTPGLGRAPGEGNGNSLQYSCLENPVDRGAWWVTGHEVARVRPDLATRPPPVEQFILLTC